MLDTALTRVLAHNHFLSHSNIAPNGVKARKESGAAEVPYWNGISLACLHMGAGPGPHWPDCVPYTARSAQARLRPGYTRSGHTWLHSVLSHI